MTPTQALPNLDLRGLPSTQRLNVFLRAFLRLHPGDSVMVVSDENPKQLLYPFQVAYAGEFDCQIRQEGPTEWVLVVSRRRDEGR